MHDLADILKEADADARDRVEGERLCSEVLPWLKMSGKWITREDLAKQSGLSAREIRQAGEYSRGAIIFGQAGIRSAESATRDELQACADALQSQADKNRRRAADVRAYLHSGFIGTYAGKAS